MGRINGITDPIFSKYATLKLQQLKLKDNIIDYENQSNSSQQSKNTANEKSQSFRVLMNPKTRWNFISMSIVWSISGFVKYLLMYYSKYFPGSMFVNYSIQSLADVICMSYISIVNKYFKSI
jgi:hypothetical protein